MAKSPIPDALRMKALKYGERPDDEKDRMAELLRAEGRRAEALLLFQGRPDHPSLAEDKRWAVEEGMSFHLLSLRRLGMAIADEDFRVCGQTAERRGRWLDARQCWAVLEDEEGLRRVAPHVPEGLRPQEEADEDAEGTRDAQGT